MITESDFISILELIQTYTWRRFIVDLKTNTLNKIFMNLYERIDPDNYLESAQRAFIQRPWAQRLPQDKEVIEALRVKDIYSSKRSNQMYLFERLEHHNNNEHVVINGNKKITIEHIFPQKPDIVWKERLSPEDFIELEGKYLHTIANLTLSGDNSSLGNKGFIEKRDFPDGGYRDSRLWLNKYLSGIDDWNISELNRRYDLIAERFLAIWPYPRTALQNMEISENEEVNIFHADSPTGKTLEYFIFLDQKRTVPNFTEFYLFVLRELFNSDPERFFSSGLSSDLNLFKSEISPSPEKLRQTGTRKAGQIAENYYVETNSDSSTKLERLKQALVIFNLEDELSIKYADSRA